MGGEGAVKLSLGFNWPNMSEASGVSSSLCALLEVPLWSV